MIGGLDERLAAAVSAVDAVLAHPALGGSGLRDQCEAAGDVVTAGHGRVDGVFVGDTYLPGNEFPEDQS